MVDVIDRPLSQLRNGVMPKNDRPALFASAQQYRLSRVNGCFVLPDCHLAVFLSVYDTFSDERDVIPRPPEYSRSARSGFVQCISTEVLELAPATYHDEQQFLLGRRSSKDGLFSRDRSIVRTTECTAIDSAGFSLLSPISPVRVL